MNYAGQTQNSNQNNPLKKWVIILGALAGVFLCTTIYFARFATPTINTVYQQVESQNMELRGELDSLLAEHNRIKEQYGELSDQLSEKDSIIMAGAAEIEKLINSQADYNRIKKQLARLQNISQEYVQEMDKLYQENKALKEENLQVRADLEQEREVTRTMQKSNEDLSQKISNAAVFKAYNIKSAGYLVRNKGTEEPTEKANKVKRIKTTLMLGENSLIEPGPVNVYCRIAIPETGKVLTTAAVFVQNGRELQQQGREYHVELGSDVRRQGHQGSVQCAALHGRPVPR